MILDEKSRRKTTIKNIEFHSILLYFYKERKRRKKFLFLIDSHLYIGPMGSLPKYIAIK